MDSANVKIAATTAAIAAGAATAFSMAGFGKLVANGLSSGEIVTLYEEYPDGVYRAAIDRRGVGIVLTQLQPTVLVEGYGNYKLAKSVTIAPVAVAYLS